MGWFDEQIKERRVRDEKMIEESFADIASAVLGHRLSHALEQKEIADSAIDEIIKYYRMPLKSADIPENVTDMAAQIEYRIHPYGIMKRSVKLEKHWYKSAIGPMIATAKEDGRAIALIPNKFSGYKMFDPKSGTKKKVNAKTEAILERDAFCFYKPLANRAVTAMDLIKYALEQLSFSDMLGNIGIVAIGSVMGLLAPVFTKLLFGDVLESGEIKMLVSIGLFMLCFAISKTLFDIYNKLIAEKVRVKQSTVVEAAVMARVMSLPISFFKDYSSGELATRIHTVKQMCASVMDTIFGTALASLFSLIYIGQIFGYAPALAVPAILVIAATFAVSLITISMEVKITRAYLNHSSKENGLLYSVISGMQKIKLAGAEKRVFAGWGHHHSEEIDILYNAPPILTMNKAILHAISLAGWLIIYYLAVKEKIVVSDYYAFNVSYAMISGAFLALSNLTAGTALIKPMYEMVKPILTEIPEEVRNAEAVDSISGDIELDHVSFRYDESMPNILDDVSLQIKKGDYVAIVGRTGSGKSTLLRLLLGFEMPQKGAVLYDKRDISKLDLKSLRKNIGVVMQDGKLFMGDIYSNIVITDPSLSMEDAWKAAKIASLDEDIKNMPMGMNTFVSEEHGVVSGGQKQRILIARAVATNPNVLIFDEATSSLDNITQKKVSDAVDQLSCTRIVAAHRLSTIRHCNRIIVLDKGKIAEDGTYEELIEKRGLFYDIVSRQRIDENK